MAPSSGGLCCGNELPGGAGGAVLFDTGASSGRKIERAPNNGKWFLKILVPLRGDKQIEILCYIVLY